MIWPQNAICGQWLGTETSRAITADAQGGQRRTQCPGCGRRLHLGAHADVEMLDRPLHRGHGHCRQPRPALQPVKAVPWSSSGSKEIPIRRHRHSAGSPALNVARSNTTATFSCGAARALAGARMSCWGQRVARGRAVQPTMVEWQYTAINVKLFLCKCMTKYDITSLTTIIITERSGNIWWWHNKKKSINYAPYEVI